MSTNPDQPTPKRTPGRPANSPTPEVVEAPPVMVEDAILPHHCPFCGRGQTPRIMRKEPSGERHVSCKLCGKGYIYSPATIRLKC